MDMYSGKMAFKHEIECDWIILNTSTSIIIKGYFYSFLQMFLSVFHLIVYVVISQKKVTLKRNLSF